MLSVTRGYKEKLIFFPLLHEYSEALFRVKDKQGLRRNTHA